MKIEIVRGRRKSLSLSYREEGFLLRAPYGITEAEITRFLEKHRRWMANRMAERENLPRLSFGDGETLSLFGVNYIIRSGRTRLESGAVYLPAEGREAALVGLLKRQAKVYMTELTRTLAARFGFTFTSVRISSARGRWGSCNAKGGISYSFRTAFLPPRLLEYLCIHELSHTRYFNHGEKFWREVERAIPDWRERRRQLKKSGGFMRLL